MQSTDGHRRETRSPIAPFSIPLRPLGAGLKRNSPSFGNRPTWCLMKEHERARAWREKHGLTPDQLGKLTGYSVSSIYWFERGEAPPRSWGNLKGRQAHKKPHPIKEWVWLRYKRACQGVHLELLLAHKSLDKWDW